MCWPTRLKMVTTTMKWLPSLNLTYDFGNGHLHQGCGIQNGQPSTYGRHAAKPAGFV